MHDLDNTRIGNHEVEDENAFSFADEAGTGFDEGEFFELGSGGGLDEQTELELARELLDVENDEELDEFIGKLFKKAVSGVKSFAKSKVGKALGGALKGVAKIGLPLAGKALGNLVVPGLGGIVGGKLGSLATKLFEVEDGEFGEPDTELEQARRFVRLATNASQKAAQMPASAPPKQAAVAAITSAARTQLGGGDANKPGDASASNPTRRATQGRWVRRGRKVILLGL